MFELKDLKEFTLMEDEHIVEQIRGNAYNDSPNPIVRLVMFFVRIIYLIIGVRFRTYIVITDKRIVHVEKKTILWGMLQGHVVAETLNKNTIQSIGYAMLSRWFISRKYYFMIKNISGIISVTYDGRKEDLDRICNQVDLLLTRQ